MAKKLKLRPAPELEVCPLTLASEKASELEIVRWVSRSIDDRSVKPEDCPDPFAWTLLRNCRNSADFQISFIEKLWSKLIPSRSQLETGNLSKIDGQVTIDLIERIQKMRGDAISDPEPIEEEPEIYDAFANHDPEEAK